MNEDDSARREFIFALFLISIVAPLLAGLAAFTAGVGLTFLRKDRERRAEPRGTPAITRTVRPSTGPARSPHHAPHRNSRRASANRRPGGVVH
ncbi:hypothetical protein [Nocardia sp. NBC_00511]|uniref:hypothetical protein n=1 Tax=Nocardia sp. NBC_00511 TaxID=2903591 RepID=UPI0030DECA39